VAAPFPPRLIKDFEIPDHLIVERIRCARMVSPSDQRVDIPIEGGYVGMVDREVFDEWLRERAAKAGAVRQRGTFERLSRDDDGTSVVHFNIRGKGAGEGTEAASIRARCVIGADGARSEVARQAVPGAEKTSYVFAYHEIIARPDVPPPGYDATRCDVVYRGTLSPDFYGWVFPHGKTLSVGTGSADKGFSLRTAVGCLARGQPVCRTR
jgi:geranylgeranyl reductase